MAFTRREFFKYSSASMAFTTLHPEQHGAGRGERPDVIIDRAHPGSFGLTSVRDPRVQEFAAIALDAAKAAGASYADVRVTVTRSHGFWHMNRQIGETQENEHGAIGVRALFDGAWGFAASPQWTRDEAARLGREATHMARTNAVINAHAHRARVELDDLTEAASGMWTTPIQRDPFTVPWSERYAVVDAYSELVQRAFNIHGLRCYAAGRVEYRRQEKLLATTLGSLQTQTLYWIEPSYALRDERTSLLSSVFQPMGGGWEIYADTYSRVREDIPRLMDLLAEKRKAVPVVPDRCDVVFDGYVMAHLLGNIVGVATELDRILGWEANAGGTSYLAPIEEHLGTPNLGSPLLTVSANRSRPGGSATVKWDDEGVAPDEYTIIKDGTFVDCHTTREFAPKLKGWYQRQQRPIRSHGCSASETAIGVPLVQPPNIVMHPGKEHLTFEELVKGMTKGVAIRGGLVFSDRQQKSGEVDGHVVYEVRNGKCVSTLGNSEVLFRTSEILKNIVAVGGKTSQVHSGMTVKKGQPEQSHTFGVSAVPALIRNVVVTDILRKS